MISRLGDRVIVKAEPVNVTKDKITVYEGHMDDRLKAVYRQFFSVYLVKPDEKTFELVYAPDMGMVTKNNFGTDFVQNTKYYCDYWVVPEDRERFMEFNDPETLTRRIANSQYGSISASFRTNVLFGTDTVEMSVVYSFSAVPGAGGKEVMLTMRQMDG